MIERKNLSDLKKQLNKKGIVLEIGPRNVAQFWIAGAFGSKVAFTVNMDDLFDGNGNYFNNDLD